MKPAQSKRHLFSVFGTPVIAEGWSWIPVLPLVVWVGMTWYAGRKRPSRTLPERMGVGAVTAVTLLGSEWLHNFAHAAAARLVGRPMDALKIFMGTPLCVYEDFNDRETTPRQHIARALGGPLFNAGLMIVARLLRRTTHPGTTAREVADFAVATNIFLSTVSYAPIPELDGGPIIKWSLVARGYTVPEADTALEKINGIAIPFYLAAAAWLGPQKKWFLAGIAGQFAVLALLIAKGWLREDAYTRWRDRV